MPQTIYQGRTTAHPPAAEYGTAVPKGWAYIGETVQNYQPPWRKALVWNRVGNAWILLNADPSKVDYALQDITFVATTFTLTLDIHDHLNWEYEDYTITINPAPIGWVNPGYAPDNFDWGFVPGMAPSTKYTFDVVANLVGGGTTMPSVQEITLPANPIPKAPINLYSPAQTNSSIDLAWSDPMDSVATSWRVYVGVEGEAAGLWADNVATRSQKVTGLLQDRKYHYYVTGRNAEGSEGPPSNVIRWATGHDTKYRTGSIHQEPIHPAEWGAWRPDIGWYDWYDLWYYNRKVFHPHLYQGYWQKDPVWTGSTVGINVESQESGRYRGIVTYDGDEFRRRMDLYHDAGVWHNLSVERAEIRRVYRHKGVGTVNGVHLEWYLTHTNVYDAAAPPPIYLGHRNNHDSLDAVAAQDTMAQGQTIDFLRLPRWYGNALAMGNYYGTAVNGIMLYQGGHVNTGAGAAGYGRWSGHGQRDPEVPNDPNRFSDWRVLITASWNFPVVSYQAPYQW